MEYMNRREEKTVTVEITLTVSTEDEFALREHLRKLNSVGRVWFHPRDYRSVVTKSDVKVTP